MDMAVRRRIDAIIEEETGVMPSEIDSSKPIREQVSLDSMQFVGVVAKIEMELEAELPVSVMNVSTLDEFYSEIEKVVCDRSEEES